MQILHEKKDCILKRVEWEEVKGFLDKYHRQKSGKPTNINYVLVYNDEIVGAATFAKNRYKYNKLDIDYEWMRLCYKTDVVIKGGTARLLSRFTETYGGNIISYQFDTFEGTMFEGLGFKLISKRRSNIYINPVTGKRTRHRFINDKKDIKLQEYLRNNPDKKVNDYFGYTEVEKDVICYTWYREAKPIGYIYRITSPEGKCYVGLKKSPVFIEAYWSSSQNKDYWRDLHKFGKDAFKREVLEWCYTNQELNDREVYWIKESKSLVTEGGYNVCLSFPNIIRTEEVNRKLRESNKKYWSNPENHIKLSDSIKNSKKYQESRKTVGKAISKGLCNLSEEEKKQKYAFTQTIEFKNKISQNNVGKKWFNNGIKNIFTTDCPEGYIPGMLYSEKRCKLFSKEHKTKLSELHKGKSWWTNGTENRQSIECPGEGWQRGRTVVVEQKKSWWNNGKEQCQSVECPGKDWLKGRLSGWQPTVSLEDFIELCKTLSYGKLAKLFNTTIPTIRSYCKNNGIRKEELNK